MDNDSLKGYFKQKVCSSLKADLAALPPARFMSEAGV